RYGRHVLFLRSCHLRSLPARVCRSLCLRFTPVTSAVAPCTRGPVGTISLPPILDHGRSLHAWAGHFLTCAFMEGAPADYSAGVAPTPKSRRLPASLPRAPYPEG